MSMLLMVKAMQAKVGNPLRKLVLLKLADNANDQGECWPSYQYIADQCEMSRRSVMEHIDALIESGFLRKELRIGSEKGNKSNLYTLRIPSAGDSLGVVQQIHYPSAPNSPPSAGDSLPPSAPNSPRTSHSLESVNEPVIEPNNKSKKLDFSSWPSMPSNQVFNDWVAVRKSKKAAITQTAINRIGKQLQIAVCNGWTVDDALSVAVSSGWTGFEASWLKRENTKGTVNQIAQAAMEFLNDRT